MAIGGAPQAKKEKSGSQESAKETSKHARFLDFSFPDSLRVLFSSYP
jgi:hypothetical protein